MPENDHPTDDELWRHPERTYQQWGGRMDVSDRTARARLRRRGWVRKRGGTVCTHCGEHVGRAPGWAKAPCCNCGRSTPVDGLTDDRTCTSCATIPNTLREAVRAEREAYRRRNESTDD